MVMMSIDTGTTNPPTALSTNTIPLGYRPPFNLYLFAAMSSNGKVSFMRINAAGTMQGSITNAAPINNVITYLTQDPYPS